MDAVVAAQGRDAFESEHARAKEYDLDGLRVRVLPLARVIARKRASSRPKDLAQLPALEATLAAREDQGDEG